MVRRRRGRFAEQTFGLCAGNVEGQLEIVGGRQIVDLGRRIDWREFHHFCLTYDGPSRGGDSDLTFYFDGDKQGRERAPGHCAGRDGHAPRQRRHVRTPAQRRPRRAYIYASALDASAIEVLYGSVSAAPTVTPVPTSHWFEGTLCGVSVRRRGDADAYNSWNGMPSTMAATEGRDGSAIVLDAERRLRHFATGSDAEYAQRRRPDCVFVGAYRRVERWVLVLLRRRRFAGYQQRRRRRSCCTYCYGCEFANCNGATTLEVASQGCCPENFVLRYSVQSYGEDRTCHDCVAFMRRRTATAPG